MITQSNPRLVNRGFLLAVIVSIILCVVTFAAPAIRDGLPKPLNWLVTRVLNLNYENNFASWWSGALWLLTAFFSLDAYRYYKRAGERLISIGWLSLACLTIALSIDEVASLHERLPLWIPGGPLFALLPYAAVMGIFSGIAVLAFWFSPSHRPQAVWIVVGLLVIISVPLSERLDHFYTYWGSYSGTRDVLEEGREILATLIFFRVAMPVAGALRRTGQSLDTDMVSDHSKGILVAGLICFLPFSVLNATLSEIPRLGQPTQWLVASLCLAAVLYYLHPDVRQSGKGPLLLPLLALVLSVGSQSLNGDFRPRYMLMGFSLVYLVYVMARIARTSFDKLGVAALGAGLVGIAVGALDMPLFAISLSVSVLGLLVFFLAMTYPSQRRVAN